MRNPKHNPDEAERAFLFRLAKDLHMTVAALESSMSTREFVEWAAYYAAEAKAEEAAQRKAATRRRR